MLHILIIDDDEVDRQALRRMLVEAFDDIRFDEAVDARSGLAAISDGHDCVLLDNRLPDMDGLEVVDKMNGVDGQPSTPVIMLTGSGCEETAVEAMKRGVLDYVPKSELSPLRLARAIRHAMDRTSLQRQLAQAREEIAYMAHHDSLTGLGNRNLFDIEIARQVAIANRNETEFALLFMDLNDFKRINDTYGHLTGDEVLAEVGQRLQQVGRNSDAFFRLGGDEFVVILNTGGSLNGAYAMAARIQEVMAAPFDLAEARLQVHGSIGFALFPDHGRTVKELLGTADAAMYAVKPQLSVAR